MHGFTLVEALVAMLIFTIGFSGLYFFFGISQQAIVSSEKQVHLNLMADRIFQRIASDDKAAKYIRDNNFISSHSGSLTLCNYSDVRNEWCTDLNAYVGVFNSKSGREVRQVEVIKEISSDNLIVNIILITESGAVKSFYSRKIRQL